MSNSYIQPKADIFAQLSWILTQKYRKLLITTLLVLIFALSFFAYYKYISMQKELSSLQAFEPIFVLKVNRDLNVGDPIQMTDLAIARVFRQEFENHSENTLFECRNEFALSSCSNLIGRVLKIPVYKGSILRQEMIAKEGIEPGIVNLLGEKEAFLDLTVPQTGFNVYLKPNDLVDIYKIDKDGSKLITKKAKIIMIDAMPLGRAPMQVKVDSSLARSLTLAVQKDDLYQLTNAVKERKTYVTLHNLKEVEPVNSQVNIKKNKATKRDLFQALTLIQGNKKEIINQ
jgi:hypothetical protein